ncbi:MAG TPA: hypothetical protein VNX65_00905 [Patescibacteria group bacterium]|jgi:hypothetical protein|nr:hypothetical protein [Patescibacteria group bacterium]
MQQFLTSNITWLYTYFEKNKNLLEIFSFLIVAQSFIYGANPQDLGELSLGAFKIILWIMVFLIILLLQVSTAIEIGKDRQLSRRIFKGANFMKTIMRLLTFTLLLASVPIFAKQIQISLNNSLFSVFYGSLALIAVLEILAITTTILLPKISHND